MKKVISFSLFGERPFYQRQALKTIHRTKQHYADWTLRFYVEKDVVPQNVIDSLQANNTEIIYCTSETKNFNSGLFWRFLVAADPTVDIWLIRDVDRQSVDIFHWFEDYDVITTWLASNKDFHIIRAHHAHLVEILSGLWGGRTLIPQLPTLMQKFLCDIDNLPNIHELKKSYRSPKHEEDMFGQDQLFLRYIIYPLIYKRSLVLSSHARYLYEKCVPLPLAGVKLSATSAEHYLNFHYSLLPYHIIYRRERILSTKIAPFLKRKKVVLTVARFLYNIYLYFVLDWDFTCYVLYNRSLYTKRQLIMTIFINSKISALKRFFWPKKQQKENAFEKL